MKIWNKFYVTGYDITTPHYKNNKSIKIMVASDIHYQVSVSRDIFTSIVKYAKESSPDFIVMTGDQIETIDFIDNHDNKEFFESIIKDLSHIAPLIMIPGNHEIRDCTSKNYRKKDKTEINTKALNYFDSLNNMNNVYFLNNQQITINNINFMGFSPRMESYYKINDKKTEEDFIEDYLKCNFKIKKDEYNILLTHSPLQLNGVLNRIDDFNKSIDLVITGYLHDGYLPKILDKPLGKTNAGLFMTPLKAPFPGIKCRGIHEFGRGYLFISQGYRKWTADFGLFNYLEKMTANDIEELIISNAEDKSVFVSQNKPFIYMKKKSK